MPTKLVTGHQARVVMLFNQYKDALLPSKAVAAMYRCEGHNVSVGLSYSEDGQHYIVRETVRWYASQQHVHLVASCLVEQLGKTYARSKTGSENLFAKL